MNGECVPFYLPPAARKELAVARKNTKKDDDIFLDDLLHGYKWQLYVLNALQAYGYWGRICPLRVRPDKAHRRAYSDKFDILIGGCDGWVLDVEVKARSQPFGEPRSFPFDNVFIEPLSRFEARKGSYPDWWAVVSTKNCSIIFTPDCHMKSWNSEVSMGRSYMSAPREVFVSLDQFLEQLPPIGSCSE